MMTPHKIEIYVYAENEQEAKELQKAMNGFVRTQYDKGLLVTARKLIGALENFGNNFFVTNYLRK